MTAATRLVIRVVGAALLVSVLGIIGLAVVGQPVPDVLQNVAVGSLTGLVGLLTNTRSAQAQEAIPGRATGGDGPGPYGP